MSVEGSTSIFAAERCRGRKNEFDKSTSTISLGDKYVRGLLCTT